MHKRELEHHILLWSRQKVGESKYKDSPIELQRLYQTGVIVGLLSSIAQDDFYAQNLIKRTVCPKN